MKILVIDDQHESFSDYFEVLLESRGDTLLVAASSEEAEQKIHQMPDVIFMDGDLEERLTGPDIVQQWRKNGLETTIIMISSDRGMQEAGVAAGANGFMDKSELLDEGYAEILDGISSGRL